MRIFILPIIILAFIGMSACCKVNLAIGVTVKYIALSGNHELKVIKQNKSNALDKMTIKVLELNESNEHQAFISLSETNNEVYNYILEVDSLVYSDTISDFSYETKGRNCNTRVESVSYLLNGTRRTDMTLVIH